MKLKHLITLLFISILSSYAINALCEFYSYKKSVDPSITLTAPRFTYLLKDKLLKEYIKYTSTTPSKNSKLKSFYITLKQSDINTLNSNLPTSGKDHYIKGYLKVSDDQQIKKIKLRYRGDSNLHWFYTQKSLRIKVLKSTYKMNRLFNLINPPHDFSIIDSVADDISKKEGLLTPEYQPARLFINGRYMGVYIFLTQIDESFLRRNKRMPGSIYYGDISADATTDKTKPAQLFYDSRFWQKKASRNAEQKSNRADIDYFIKNINTKDALHFYNFAKTSLNLEKYYKFFALDTLFGAFHHDYAHNHKLYFDPYKGKFEPIQWDLRYWSASKKKDTALYPLLLKFKLNPLFEAARDRVAYSILKRYPAKKIIKMLKGYESLIEPDLKSDIYRDTGVRPPFFPKGIAKSFTMQEFKHSIQAYANVIKQREKNLYTIYNNSSLAYNIKPISKDLYLLHVEVDGNSPIKMTFKKTTIYKDMNFDNRLDKNDTKIDQDYTILYPARKLKKRLNSIFLYGDKTALPAPCFYSFIISSSDIDNFKFTNYITGAKLRAKKRDVNYSANYDSIHPWAIPQQKAKQITLSGTIDIKNDISYGSKTKVIIKEGTTLYLYPKVSIFFKGVVISKGTKDTEIRFLPKYPDKPWGSIVLQGQMTSGSLFSYTSFKDGSIVSKNLINYTAPLSIHDSSNIQIQDVTIERNHKGDDAFHIAYSSVKIKNLHIFDARSDALDSDISKIDIQDSTLLNSGNDALDIMTTTLRAVNNTFEKTGDKGISVGEASKVILKNNLFIDNYIALAVKDNSKVQADSLYIINPQNQAISLYNKNKRYSKGGSLSVKNIYINIKPKITKDKKSTLHIGSIHQEKSEKILERYKDEQR